MHKDEEVNLGLEAEVSEVPREEAHFLAMGLYAPTFATKSTIKSSNFIFDWISGQNEACQPSEVTRSALISPFLQYKTLMY